MPDYPNRGRGPCDRCIPDPARPAGLAPLRSNTTPTFDGKVFADHGASDATTVAGNGQAPAVNRI